MAFSSTYCSTEPTKEGKDGCDENVCVYEATRDESTSEQTNV